MEAVPLPPVVLAPQVEVREVLASPPPLLEQVSLMLRVAVGLETLLKVRVPQGFPGLPD